MKKIALYLPFVVFIMNYGAVSAQRKSFSDAPNEYYKGIHFSGQGNKAYLASLDSAYMMMEPDARLENLSLLYEPEWNGFTEGPTWHGWWIQNSFGPTYTMLPFMDKAYQTFVYNSQAMWFDAMGNNSRKDNRGNIGPNGVLVGGANPKGHVYKQADGNFINKHDWVYGHTIAGILMQAELMLIRRDKNEIEKYLPLLEQGAAFIDDRRDKNNNMFLMGAASNLLGPSFSGTGKIMPDGSFGKAYLAEISINYIATLDRLIEVEKMAGREEKVQLYTQRIKLIKKGLSNFLTPQGYYVRSIDPDGTKHGVYGAAEHGYFEVTPNADAVAFRIADNGEANKIFDVIKSIPGLRPYKLIIPNYPSYDDMEQKDGLFKYGRWVNGGEWSTLGARAQIGFFRVGAYNEAKDAFQQMLDRAKNFRLDNNLSEFGSKEYQPNKPINCVYDCWGLPGGFLRGLFEYVYKANGLQLYPHIPTGITTLQQNFPVYFGQKKIYLSVSGSGRISAVSINGKAMKNFTKEGLFLSLDATPGTVYVAIGLGGNKANAVTRTEEAEKIKTAALNDNNYWNINLLRDAADTVAKATPKAAIDTIKKISLFYAALVKNNLAETYEAHHAALLLKVVTAINERRELKEQKKLKLLPEKSQIAADNLYISTAENLAKGLVRHLEENKDSSNEKERKIYSLWTNN